LAIAQDPAKQPGNIARDAAGVHDQKLETEGLASGALCRRRASAVVALDAWVTSSSSVARIGVMCCARFGLAASSTRDPARLRCTPEISPGAFSKGMVNQNTEPRPGSERTPMRPPIKSTSFLQIVNPKPVPP